MIDYIFASRLFVYLTTILLQVYFIYRTLPKKSSFKKQVIITATLVLLRLLTYTLEIPIRPLIEFTLNAIFTVLLFQGGYLSRLVCVTIPMVLDSIINAIAFGVYNYVFGALTYAEYTSGVERPLIFLAANVLTFISYYFITRGIDKYRDVKPSDLPVLFAIPCGCYIMLVLNYNVIESYSVSNTALLSIFENIFLFAMIVGAVGLYNRTVAQERALARAKAMLKTEEMTRTHINDINDMLSRLSELRHSIKTHVEALSGYILADNLDGAKKYVSEMTEIVNKHRAYANHPALNAVIGVRAKEAAAQNIDFHVVIALPETPVLSDVELCALIGNMLDNAFEANSRVKENKFIQLIGYVENSQLIISCKNVSADPSTFKTTGAVQSTKREGGIHGVGTLHIKSIAESNGGFATFRNENHVFYAFVTMRIPDAATQRGKYPV